MLKQRVITALILLAVLLPALFYSEPQPFCALMLLFIAAGGWEWGRLNGLSQLLSWATAGACLMVCALAWWAGALEVSLRSLWVVVGPAWVLGSAALLRGGVSGWPRVPLLLRWLAGLLALVTAWLAVAQAKVVGVNFLLSVLVLVWVADIFAYFAGRAFGLRFTRNKLAPSISPGKSWEGVWGGLAGVVVLAWVWPMADASLGATVPSFYSRLMGQGWPFAMLAVLFMGAMSVVGDLVESLIKRSVGAKDSSGLLPGHGGVLDRVDALLPTLPLAMMLSTLI